MPRSSTTFKPGVSGNPNGRPKKRDDIDIEALAKSHAPEAIATLVNALHHPKLCVQAAVALLDRGFGRPRQQISGDAGKPLIVDFKWNDGTNVSTAAGSQVIDAVAEQIAIAVEADAEPVAWQND